MSSLGRRWNCDPTTIKNILKVYGYQGRSLSSARRNFLGYTLNEDIFETIDAPEKAYWLGVIYSDGYISKINKYTNYLGISVAERDLEWIKKFKNFLNYNGEIKHYTTSKNAYTLGSKYVRLLIGNNKLVSDLERLGVVEQKTKKIKAIPDIPYKDDFIRGYIDGDGALTKRSPHIIISGNKEMLLDIAAYFKLPFHLY